MANLLDVAVWDEEQALCDSPPEAVAVKLWAEVARALLGEGARATVEIDCDDGDTELWLRTAGFRPLEADAAPEVEDSLTLAREGVLSEALDAVLRLPPSAPLGALATASGKGVDLDLGAGLDVWGPGALDALRRGAERLGVPLHEHPPED